MLVRTWLYGGIEMTYCIKCQKSDPHDKRPYGVMDWICGNCYSMELSRGKI